MYEDVDIGKIVFGVFNCDWLGFVSVEFEVEVCGNIDIGEGVNIIGLGFSIGSISKV